VKQVIVARTDLGMSPGKLAAQVAHASLAAYERAADQARREWKRDGQKKVVLGAPAEATLFERKAEADAAGLPRGHHPRRWPHPARAGDGHGARRGAGG
jgi:PTH2 family peptidyl-tRNA hydrolase